MWQKWSKNYTIMTKNHDLAIFSVLRWRRKTHNMSRWRAHNLLLLKEIIRLIKKIMKCYFFKLWASQIRNYLAWKTMMNISGYTGFLTSIKIGSIGKTMGKSHNWFYVLAVALSILTSVSFWPAPSIWIWVHLPVILNFSMTSIGPEALSTQCSPRPRQSWAMHNQFALALACTGLIRSLDLSMW